METILLVINIILAVILVLLVLIQKSEGGALGIGVDAILFESSWKTSTVRACTWHEGSLKSCLGLLSRERKSSVRARGSASQAAGPICDSLGKGRCCYVVSLR